MINDTLHIGDIVVENKQSFIVEGTPYSQMCIRDSIYSFPVHNNLNITEVIRKEMFKLCPTVKTIVHTYNVPLRMNVNNDVFKRQFRCV